MKEMASRLRAAMTPQIVLLLAALFLLSGMMLDKHETDSSQLEKRVSAVLSEIDGAGRVSVVIRTREVGVGSAGMGSRNTETVPCGAVAVVHGAPDPAIGIEISGALCALLGLPASQVSVVSGGK